MVATALSSEDWHLAWPAGNTRTSGHRFFSNFADSHDGNDVTREIVGKGSNKETKLTHQGGKDSALGVDKSSEAKDHKDAPASHKDAGKDEKAGEADTKKHDSADAAEDAKGKGKGKGLVDDVKGKGKGKGGHNHHRHHSRRSRHRHRHRRHRSHSASHHRRHASASKRMKHLLQRQRQLRSLSPRGRSRGRSRSLSPWRYGDRFSSSPKSVASLRRSVGLLEVPKTTSSRALDAAHAAPAVPWDVLGRRRPKDQATAFLFNIGKDADEANQIDQETDQLEIQEEAKTIVNAEGAGYDPPTGVEEGEEDEFEHEMEEMPQGAAAAAAGDFSQPSGPGCQCNEWDPLTTALPEDKQHASLVMLQRRIRPENHVAPSLREAAASVEHAGRLFEGWVHRRQQLADVLPDLAVKMESCHNRAKNFAKSAAEKALNGLEERLEEEEEAEADAEEQAEMAEGQNRFEAVAEAQEDFNEMVQEEHAMPTPGAPLHQPGQTAFQAQGVEQLAQAMGQIYGHGGHGPPPIQGEVPAHAAPHAEQTPEEAVMEAPQQLEVEEEIQEDADLEQAKEVENWGDFFRECGEFRIPPTVLAARRAANEAYWAFDRAMHVAEKKVGRAIQHSLIRGA